MKKIGPFTVKEFAIKKGRSKRTIRRWAREFPEKHNLEVQKKKRNDGGTDQFLIWEIVEKSSSDPKQSAKKSDDLSTYPLEIQLEILLHRKTIGKTVNQRTSMRKYYRDIFKKTGVIPKGILSWEGRKASGRKRVISLKIEQRFVEMVHKSASDVNSQDFITKKLRTIVNYHRRLEDEFKKNIPLDALYRLVKKHKLKIYIYKLDYDEAETKKILYCFKSLSVFDQIQIDGCVLHYIQIKNENGKWVHPRVIEYYDMASRYMIYMELFFSESNEDSIESFVGFLESTSFPKKTIRLTPDQAPGFLNFKRPIHELNQKYSLFPGKFYMNPDFARPRKPKDKAQLESCHRRVHGFEDFIIYKLYQKKFVERIPGIKIKNKIETITISRLDITIEELRSSGLIRQYAKENNKKMRTFSESGIQTKWIPEEKFNTYLSGVETFKFKKSDIEDCFKYGLQKKKATVSPKGKIRYQKSDYQVVKGDFYGGKKNIEVRVSEYKNKLYIFECAQNGVAIGEAMLISEYKNTENVEKVFKKQLKLNEFEQLVQYLKQHGMLIKGVQLERLMELHSQGLTINIAAQIVKLHKNKYDSYLKNVNFSNLQVGLVLINLFFAHFTEYTRSEMEKEKPYYSE